MFLFDSKFSFNNANIEALVIFSGQLEGGSEDYGYLFEKELRNDKPRPQIVFFIYPSYLDRTMLKISKPGSEFYDNIIRYGERTPVILCSFDDFSRLSITRKIFSNSANVDLTGLEKNIINDGILYLAKKRKEAVVMKSPPGTVFVKPSKNHLDEFIQASGLTVGYSENQFIAFSLLYFKPRNTIVKKIYIDTSGISSFIEALSYYLYRFSLEECKPVKYYSFNSYFGLDKERPDDTSDIWVIISASNSNSLGKKIVKEWFITDEQVLTILSYRNKSKDGNGDSIVCNIFSISDGYKKPEKFLPTIGVKVIGENFTVQVCEPNQVNIRYKHKTVGIRKCINPYNDSNVFKCLKTKSSGGDVRPVFVEMLNIILKDKGLIEWIDSLISWYIPTTLKWIIYDYNDMASNALYKLIQSKILNNKKIKLCSYKEAETNIKGDGAVLVLEPVISDGKSLLRLNRNLRISRHTGNRIFVCPFVTASSEAGFKNFKKSLTFGTNGLKYQFLNFYEIFIGHSNGDTSWALERKVVENLEAKFWRHREKTLSREGEGIKGEVGTPSLTDDEKLSFTPDFVFWDAGYECSDINPEAVYVTIASILQSLREKAYRDDDKDSLFTHVYQHSVIDPENFTRFNDCLIQSCLWRAANASEVDYKSSDDLSETFSAIVRRHMIDMTNGFENSALDLLMGIAVGKVSLTKNVLKNLLDEGHKNLIDFDYAIELLNHIEHEYLN